MFSYFRNGLAKLCSFQISLSLTLYNNVYLTVQACICFWFDEDEVDPSFVCSPFIYYANAWHKMQRFHGDCMEFNLLVVALVHKD